jgi:O-antigen ligase
VSPLGAPTVASSLPGTGVIVAVLAAALVLIAVLAELMRRYPDAFPLLAILTLPFRVPVSADGKTVNLLIPLYVVVAAGAVARLLPSLLRRRRPAGAAPSGGGAPSGDLAPSRRVPPFGGVAPSGAPPYGWPSEHLPGWLRRTGWPSGRTLGWLLFAAVALYTLQLAYSADAAKAAENIAFFYLPFSLLFVLLRDVTWTRELLIRCLAVAVALAVVFAGIGFVEYQRKALFLNPRVVAANQYDNYFRVNSLFFDPNIYGRFLALVMIAVTTVVLWSRRRRDALLGGAVLAWLLAGLITSFSQSSIAALLLGLAVLAAWRWQVRATVYASVGLVALAGAVILLSPASLHFGLKGSGGSSSNATSGRTKLISGGLELFAKRPLQGYGSGSFEVEYKRHGKTTAVNATSASHTIPVTVAAEQGILGLALYVALLVTAALVLFRGAGRSPPRIAIAACFAALVLHTWTYADFLEDPFTWTLLAVGTALARGRPRAGQVAF